VPFTITFVPKDKMSSSAILSFASDAKNAPTEQVVTVRRVDLVQHKVQLSWKASTSKHLADTTYIVVRDRVGRTKRSMPLRIQAQSIPTCM
jgi:hypothetical protein